MPFPLTPTRRGHRPVRTPAKLVLAVTALGLLAGLAAIPAAARIDAAAPSGTACTRYASPAGNDRARGTKAAPFKTPQRLVDSLRPGQTGCLRGGRYDEGEDGYIMRVGHGGRQGAPIRLRSHPGERALLYGTTYIPNGSNHVILSHLTLEGAGDGSHTIKIYSADVVVQDSELTNGGRGESCMMLGSADKYGHAVRTIVRRNRFHDCGSRENDNKDHAIYAGGTVDVRIVGNVFWNTMGYSVHMYPYARGTLVAHNVIDGGEPSVRGGILIAGNDEYASSGNVIEHNVIAYAVTSNVISRFDSDVMGSGNVVRNNCLWAARDGNVDRDDGGFTVAANVVAAPGFVARGQRDYRLRRGSRCLGVVGYDAAARLLPRRQ